MFSRFFIDRPIFATVISVVITLAGFVAVWTLPVAQYPEGDAADRAGDGRVSRRQCPDGA